MGWVVFFALVALFLALQVAARRHLITETSLSPGEIRGIFRKQFGSRLWDTADSGERWWARPKFRARSPEFAVEAERVGTTTEVEIWAERYHTYAGAMFHALLVWRKKRAFISAINNHGQVR